MRSRKEEKGRRGEGQREGGKPMDKSIITQQKGFIGEEGERKERGGEGREEIKIGGREGKIREQ